MSEISKNVRQVMRSISEIVPHCQRHEFIEALCHVLAYAVVAKDSPDGMAPYPTLATESIATIHKWTGDMLEEFDEFDALAAE